MKKTALSLAIGLALCGSASMVLAQEPPPPGAEPVLINSPPDGQSPPSGGEQPPPTGGEQPPPTGGEQPPPTGGEQPPPTGGEQPPPTGGEQPPPTGGEQPPPTGGEQPPPTGGEQPPPTGGEQPPPTGGEQPPPTGGEQPPPTGGEQPPPTGGEQPQSGGQHQPGEPLPLCSPEHQSGGEPCEPPKLPPCAQGGQPDNTSECQPRLEDFGIKPNELEGFDHLKPEEIRGFGSKHIKEVPPQAFKGMGPEQLRDMPYEALEGMTSEQFEEMPPEAMGGLEAHNMGGLSAEVIHQLKPEHLSHMNKEHFQSMPDEGVAKMVMNLDPEQVKPEDLKSLLPDNWNIEDDGTVKPAPGAKLAMPPKQPKNPLSSRMKLPTMPDFSKGIAIGGQVSKGQNTLDGLNEGLALAGYSQFKFEQQEDVLTVEGSGDVKGFKLAFIPDANGMRQAEENAPAGLAQNEQGQFVITTPDKREIPVIPAPKDTEGLLEVIPDEGRFEMGERGDVFLELPGKTHPHVVCMVDSFVGEAPPDMPPGVHFTQTPEGQEEGMIIYEDGTMQEMQPAVMAPQKFIEGGQEIDGVEEITQRMDGTFDMMFKGRPLRIEPNFDVQTESVAEGEEVEPEVILMGDDVEYTVQNGTELLKTKLKVHPTVPFPNTFIEEGSEFEGVENITHERDGSFRVIHRGVPYHLKPTSDVETELLAEGEVVEPGLSFMPDNSLEYTVQHEMKVFRIKLIIQ